MKKIFLYALAMIMSHALHAQSQMTNNGSLQMFANSNLAAYGDFVNNGSFFSTGGTVYFNGAAVQLMGGTQPTAFYNLTINNASTGVNLNNAASVSALLTFTSGSINASNNPLTLLSTASAIAGASASSYVIAGDGVTTTGFLKIDSLAVNVATLFPVGTASYYLPATINPGTNTFNSYSSYVFTPATTNSIAGGPAFSSGALSQILNAVWDVTRTSGAGMSSLTLDWASSGSTLEGLAFQGFGLNIGISQYNAGTWQPAIGSGSVAAKNATASFANFTHFGVAKTGTVLAILLNGFNAILQNHSVLLSWATLNEVSIENFQVQRSTNLTDWKMIGSVQAKLPVSVQTDYSFIDSDPAAGTDYYRLLIKNISGAVDYSSIRAVGINADIQYSIYPNPANNKIFVSTDKSGSVSAIRLISQRGDILQTIRTADPNGILSMNVGKYATGSYVLQVIGSDGKATATNILIEH